MSNTLPNEAYGDRWASRSPGPLARSAPLTIVRKVGRGPTGAVHLARDVLTGELLALKVVHAGIRTDEQAWERIRETSRKMKALQHPNVARIIDVGDEFIASEWVDGVPVDDLSATGDVFSIAEACHLALQVLAALEAAHRSAGLAHGNLKPSNVLISGSRRTPVVKLTDFALCAPRRTKFDKVLLNPRYIAPERVRGAPVDHRADLYGVALLLYELLSGDLPFEAAGAPSWDRLRPLANVNSTVPEALCRLVDRTLSVDPNRRCQTPTEFARELLPFVSVESPEVAAGRGPGRAELVVRSTDERRRARRRRKARDFPTEGILGLRAPACGSLLSDSLLCSPVIPKAPPAPRIENAPFLVEKNSTAAQDEVCSELRQRSHCTASPQASASLQSRASEHPRARRDLLGLLRSSPQSCVAVGMIGLGGGLGALAAWLFGG